MYTGKPLPPMPEVLEQAGWAVGMVHTCEQSALCFGSDRREPVFARPVVELCRDGPRAVVLPCTSKDRSNHPAFRELREPEEVMWVQPSDRRTFVFERYEVVDRSALRRKLGTMAHGSRITLLEWVKERH